MTSNEIFARICEDLTAQEQIKLFARLGDWLTSTNPTMTVSYLVHGPLIGDDTLVSGDPDRDE